MSFTGELEHLPIVDVIQLMNSSRKSGLLSVKGRKGESKLVFKDGYIVSATHLNNSVRIGDVLVDMGMISPEQLDQGLKKQQLDGKARKPLAITLIEMELLRGQDAYKGLQRLIEMTIVEILTWKTGKFTLDHHTEVIDCEFRYYPEKMNHEVNLNTQSILMEALRIFDEKVRDGLIQEEKDEPEFAEAIIEGIISIDDLGLSEIDHLSTRLPEAFSGVAKFDPVSFQMTKITTLAPSLSAADQKKLASLLARHTLNPGAEQVDPSLPYLFTFSSDSLLIHSLGTVSRAFGVHLKVFGSAEELETPVKSVMNSGRPLRVIIDAPPSGGNGAAKAVLDLQGRLANRFAGIVMIQLEKGREMGFTLNSYRSGVRAVLPKPSPETGPASFADDFIGLINFLPRYLLTD